MCSEISPSISNDVSFSGALLVNKPKGLVSKDVSRWLQKLIGKQNKMGHLGTLDPMAEGLLPMLIGKATRLHDFLLDGEKEYEFKVQFGVETDTLDGTGKVINQTRVGNLTVAAIESSLDKFRGDIWQIPPIYSAVKYQGQALYKFARHGNDSQVPLEKLKRRITVKDLRFKKLTDGIASFTVRCSKGLYVRRLGSDIAKELGTLGTVVSIIRTKTGGFCLNSSHQMAEIETAIKDRRFVDCLVPISNLPINKIKWTASNQAERALRFGQKVFVRQSSEEAEILDFSVRKYDLILLNRDSRVFGIGEVHNDNGLAVLKMKRQLL